MVGPLFVVKFPDTRDERMMTARPCPLNGLGLRPEGRELVIGVVLDDVIVDAVPLGPTFGPRLNENVRHDVSLSPRLRLAPANARRAGRVPLEGSADRFVFSALDRGVGPGRG